MDVYHFTGSCLKISVFLSKLMVAAGIVSLFEKNFEWSIGMFVLSLLYNKFIDEVNK